MYVCTHQLQGGQEEAADFVLLLPRHNLLEPQLFLVFLLLWVCVWVCVCLCRFKGVCENVRKETSSSSSIF
jgi:hypothetical protein